MSRIEDVALAAGVSTATVSRALRGLPKVSDSTRERVLAAAARLEYVASPTASSLASGKTRVVAVVVPYVNRWYFSHLISGASRVLRRHGYHVLLFDLGDNGPQRSLLIDQQMLWKRVDAVLVFQLRLQDAETELLQRLQVPVVTVGASTGEWGGVSIDDVDVAVTATEHLISLGHTDIAFIGGEPAPELDFVTPSYRQHGFVSTMTAHGCAPPPSRMVMSDWTVAGGLAAGEQLLDGPDRPTAIFAASDEMAIGVLMAARRLDVAVPMEVSVIGVDDHELSAAFELTTVRQPVIEQGQQASILLLQSLEHPDEPVVHTTLDTELVVRGSTAPPRVVAPCSAAELQREPEPA
ncbi:MAG TPA: LacI family DNA-binding transcriptional regulator [Actinomycetales bacterium]|jgi:DNA-binding LacI/PurR family transcriptional regulator